MLLISNRKYCVITLTTMALTIPLGLFNGTFPVSTYMSHYTTFYIMLFNKINVNKNALIAKIPGWLFNFHQPTPIMLIITNSRSLVVDIDSILNN